MMKQSITNSQNYTFSNGENRDYAIATYGLTKRYDGYIAVNEVDLRVAKGKIYGLMGFNGAGKTTLMKMLAAAEAPTTGEIYYDSNLLTLDNSSENIKRYLGYLPDDYPLYDDLTVWDYLDYFARLYNIPARRRRVRIYEVLELVNLEEKRNSLITTLSRGMKQRLSLARTIIHEPIVLLLDEPVSGLDFVARKQFDTTMQVLQEAGMTIVIASPVLKDLTEVCTTIGIMDRGFLVDTIETDEINHQSSQIIITTVEDISVLITELSKNLSVKKWEKIPSKNSLKISLLGGEAESAKLMRSLLAQNITVTEFKQVQEDWETIVLKRINQTN